MNIRAERRRLISQVEKENLDYIADIGINGGCPIFSWQENTIFTPAGQYEIGKNGGIEKTIELNLSSAGEIGFEIKPLKEPVIVRLLDEDMEVLDTSTIISAPSNIVLDSTDETKVVLYTTGRALVEIVNYSTTAAILTITEKKRELGILTSSIEHSYSLPTAWDGSVSESLEQIDGVYQIGSGADLAKFSAVVNGGETTANAALTADINLGNRDWFDYAIGEINAYQGIFDGQGHIIYKFALTANKTNSGALFYAVDGGTLKDFKVKDATILVTRTTGNVTTLSAVCGTLKGGGTIDNIYVDGNISGTGYGDAIRYTIGGIASNLVGGTGSKPNTVSNCYAKLNIFSYQIDNFYSANRNVGIGGIVGIAETGSKNLIYHCGFGGTIDVPNASRIAGVIGTIYDQTGTTVDGCYNTGNITGNTLVAGIIAWGHNMDFGTTAYNTGNITATNESSNNSYIPAVAGIGNQVRHTNGKYVYNAGNVVVKSEDDDLFDSNRNNAQLFTQFSSNSASSAPNRVYRNDIFCSDGATVKYSATGRNNSKSSAGTGYSLAQISSSEPEVLDTLNERSF